MDQRQLRKLQRQLDSYSRYDASTLLHWTTTDPDNGVRCAVAMMWIDKYLIGAQNQFRRIKRLKTTLDRGFLKPGVSIVSRQRAMTEIFIEVHFYFICWDSIRKMVAFLRSHSGFKVINEIYKRRKKLLEDYGAARDHLEHYNERLLGRRKGKALSNPSDMGNLHGYIYSLGGEKYDVGPDSLKRLKKIVKDLNAQICKEGMIRYRKINEQENVGHPSK